MKHLKKFNKFKLFLLTLAFILSPHLLSAQNQSLGNITTAGTDCSVATRCVVYVNQPQYGGASISVTGTFVGTLQFEGTGNGAGDNWSSYYTALAVTPYAGGSQVTQTTGPGAWTVNTSGLIGVRVRASALSSGTAVVLINYGIQSATTRGSAAGGSNGFANLTSGTNSQAAMVIGTGASLTVSGSGTINATAIDGVTVNGTPTNGQCPVASNGTTAAWGSCGGSAAFSGLTGGTNTTAAMIVGTGASLTVSGSGTINATTLGGATFSSPGAIGGTTASTGAFTTLSATGQFTSTVTTGTAPFVVSSTTAVANLAIGGNAGTATALATAGGQCSAGQAANGVDASGNAQNCVIVNTMTTLGDAQFGGASGALTRLAGPTSPNGVPQYIVDIPAAGAAVAEVFSLAGIPVDTTSPATLLVTDRATYLKWTTGTALALPAVATSFASNMPFVLQNTEGATLTITPNAGASDLIDGSSSGTLLNTFAMLAYQESGSAPGHWDTIKFPTFAAFGSTCTSAESWSTTTGFTCNTNLVNASSPGAGVAHFAGSTQTVTSSAVVGSDMASNTVTATQLAAQYSKGMACDGKGLGDGLNAMAAGTYLQSTCRNTSGVTETITGVLCFTDNSGSSTLNASGNTLGALLTGAITCSSSYASGTQSANVLLTANDYIKFTFVADGTSKQTDWVVTYTY